MPVTRRTAMRPACRISTVCLEKHATLLLLLLLLLLLVCGLETR